MEETGGPRRFDLQSCWFVATSVELVRFCTVDVAQNSSYELWGVFT